MRCILPYRGSHFRIIREDRFQLRCRLQDVEFEVLAENDVRDTIAQNVADQAGQYDDAITISNAEVLFDAETGLAGGVQRLRVKDAKFDQRDSLEPPRSEKSATRMARRAPDRGLTRD